MIKITLHILLWNAFHSRNIIFHKQEETRIKGIQAMHKLNKLIGKFMFIQSISNIMIQLIIKSKHHLGLFCVF
ncbi:hypothetical protein D3C76_1534260 [compost metagenome]